jgi:hypothetical protein
LIPRNPEDLLKLADKVYSKHQADGTKSELNNLDEEKYDWDKVAPTIPACLALHDKAEKLKSEMEQVYRQRDALLLPIDFHVKGSSTYLKGKYSTNPKKLGEWGFEIDDTPKAPKKKP